MSTAKATVRDGTELSGQGYGCDLGYDIEPQRLGVSLRSGMGMGSDRDRCWDSCQGQASVR